MRWFWLYKSLEEVLHVPPAQRLAVTTIGTIQVMWGLENHGSRGPVSGFTELEDESLSAYRIAASRKDLYGGKTASNRQFERVVVSVKTVDASEPWKNGAVSRIDLECAASEGGTEEADMGV